mgnify:CR=1 FL=1
MSVEIPKVAIAFGVIGVPQGDVIDLRVHLGCTKEVGSFECLLQNWDKRYSPSGTSPIDVGMDGHIDIGRGSNVPQIITCRVESVKYESTPTENYVRVSGRCWGEKLFRRVVTKTYENQKGEEIVKDLLDNYVGLSHVRDSTELVENTDTTYTKLEYDNTPVWDIIKYIAESADKAGVIGFDFRVAPDGKFEFFPKNSKASPVSLSEKIEVSEYRKDIHRIRNKVLVYGLADKSYPLDKDAWTETLTPADGAWSGDPGDVSFDTTKKVRGTGSIKLNVPVSNYYGRAVFTLNAGREANGNKYPVLSFYAFLEESYSGNVAIQLYDAADKGAERNITVGPGEWRKVDSKVGKLNEIEWEYVAPGFDWMQIKKVMIQCWFPGTGTGSFWVDALHFGGCRYSALREDSGSQSAYGLRELTETDEELISDNECDLRAKSLLDYFKNPAEYVTVTSAVIDYGNTPLLAGDKIHVVLPNENVDSDFSIETVEYRVDAKTQTLEITLELGNVPPMLADYLYGLRATTVTVEKLARTKLGKGMGASGGGAWAPDWIWPTFIGPKSDVAAITQFRTKNIAGTSPVNHHFDPSDNEYGLLGRDDCRWLEIWTKYLNVTASAKVGQLNISETIVITPTRILQNVSADAAIITSGNFLVDRLARGPAGYVLEVQGVDYNPMYVNPNYRYEPKSHSHYHSELLGVGPDDHHAQSHNHAGEALSPNSIAVNTLSVAVSVNCQNWLKSGDFILANDFRITEAEKLGFQKGLAFLSGEGKVLMVLDGEGNLSVAGRIARLI